MRKNLIGADNQQERSREFLRGYVTGLVDGEGSFHIAFQRRKDLPIGISIIPEFHISQHSNSLNALRVAQEILGCGYLKPNHVNSSDSTYVLVVRDRYDLLTKVIPFFECNCLQTSKGKDFSKFAKVVKSMYYRQSHKLLSGSNKIIDLAYSMNQNGKRRTVSKAQLKNFLKSSETIWRTRRKTAMKK